MHAQHVMTTSRRGGSSPKCFGWTTRHPIPLKIKSEPGIRRPVSSTRYASKKYSRTRNPNLENPLHCSTLKHRSKIPNAIIFFLLNQCAFTWNLLRHSRGNTIMSAYTTLEGTLYFYKTTLASKGWKVFIHENTDARRTW